MIDGKSPSRGVRALSEICVQEEREAAGKPKKKKEDASKEMAIAFTKITPTVDLVISTLGEDLYLNDAYEILFKQKSKYSKEKYGTPTYITKITSLEQQVKLLDGEVSYLKDQAKVNKQELVKAQENSNLKDELFEDFKKELPPGPKTAKMMSRIFRKYTAKERG